MIARLMYFLKKHILITLLIMLFVFCIIGYILLVLSYCLPTQIIREHIKEDYLSVVSVGEWIPGHDDTVPDYYTDSIMLLEAEYDSRDSVFLSAIKSPRALLPDTGYVYETFLKFNEENDNIFYEYDYFRYWHGYLIILKPLLFLFNLGTVKYIMILFQFILIFSFIYYGTKSELSFKYLIPVLAAYIYINPITIGLSLQYNTVYSITLLSLIILFIDYKDRRLLGEGFMIYFLMIGILTSYFDLMTYPIVSFGVPVIYYFLLYCLNEKKDYIKFFIALICWGIGFAGMWIGKWIFSIVIFGKKAVNDILNSISIRTGFDASESFEGEYITFSNVLYKNLSVQIVYGTLIIIIAGLVLLFGITRKKIQFKNIRTSFLVICFLISLIPFIWYFFMPNHSYIHYWFTYRSLAVSVCAILMFSFAVVDRIGDGK